MDIALHWTKKQKPWVLMILSTRRRKEEEKDWWKETIFKAV